MTGKSSLIPNVQPPNPPWLPIQKGPSDLATISFYYSDRNSPSVPVRDVSHKHDAKRDPNIETLTYGLFSDCCEDARKAIVEKGIGLQFFCTLRANVTRVLTGYYRPAWYCEMGDNDYAIAAESARFISPGYALGDLVQFLEEYPIDRFFRPWKYIKGEKAIQRLLLLINVAPDATKQHISEIHRLEMYSLEQYGQMYADRFSGLSWEYAAELMRKQGLV